MITNINHIAIVVPELEAGMGFWADALGLPIRKVEDVAAEQVRIAFLPVGGSQIELLEPTSADSGVARYLDKRGPGMHHICLEVDRLDAVLARLREANVPLIDEEPQERHGTRYAFVHPKGTGGVLVELYELPSATHDTSADE